VDCRGLATDLLQLRQHADRIADRHRRDDQRGLRALGRAGVDLLLPVVRHVVTEAADHGVRLQARRGQRVIEDLESSRLLHHQLAAAACRLEPFFSGVSAGAVYLYIPTNHHNKFAAMQWTQFVSSKIHGHLHH